MTDITSVTVSRQCEVGVLVCTVGRNGWDVRFVPKRYGDNPAVENGQWGSAPVIDSIVVDADGRLLMRLSVAEVANGCVVLV
jgi:hypothetical protein